MTQDLKTRIDDPVERDIADALTLAGVEFTHEKEGAKLDFYLPKYEINIECKAYYTDRVNKQLADNPDTILIQGYKAAASFLGIIRSLEAKVEALSNGLENTNALLEMAEKDIENNCPPTYCPECKSCGIEECCNPDSCKMVKCIFGEGYMEELDKLQTKLTERDKLLDVVGEALTQAKHYTFISDFRDMAKNALAQYQSYKAGRE